MDLESFYPARDRQELALRFNSVLATPGFDIWMKGEPAVLKVEVAGSYRRKKETVGDLDLLVASNNPEKSSDRFVSMPPISRIISKGPTKSTVMLKGHLQVDCRVVVPEAYGAALQYFTGSKDNNVKLRTIGVKLGYKLNEYGLFRG
jgi:DNA polymerase (family 10)